MVLGGVGGMFPIRSARTIASHVKVGCHDPVIVRMTLEEEARLRNRPPKGGEKVMQKWPTHFLSRSSL